MSKMTPQEWLDKADWEGGILDGLAYGLRALDVKKKYPHFRSLISEAESLYAELDYVIDAILDYNEEDEK